MTTTATDNLIHTFSTATDPASSGVDESRLRRLADAIKADVEAERCVGVALRVVRNGEVVVDVRAGIADQATGRPVGDDTVFATQSVGKQFVHSMVLSYVERGLLALHEPVSDVLPEFGVRGKERITLAQLLTHTSGLTSSIPPLDVLGDHGGLYEFAAQSLIESEPGSCVRYSTICAAAVMSQMMLTVDGRSRSLTQFFADELFGPLGMHDTSLGLREDLRDRFAPFAACFTDNGLFSPEAIGAVAELLTVPGVELASGGYVSTIADLSRFAEMLRRGGELDGFRLLSPAMLALATRNHTGALSNNLWDYTLTERKWDPFPAYLGLGFFLAGEQVTPGFIGALASPRSFGGFGAGSTCFWVDPEQGMTFSLLTTGLMEESRHIERCRKYSDLVLAAVV